MRRNSFFHEKALQDKSLSCTGLIINTPRWNILVDLPALIECAREIRTKRINVFFKLISKSEARVFSRVSFFLLASYTCTKVVFERKLHTKVIRTFDQAPYLVNSNHLPVTFVVSLTPLKLHTPHDVINWVV